MTKQTVVDHVNQVLIENFEMSADQLVPTAHIKDDLRMDSLDAVDMIVFVESELDIEIDPEKFREVQTLDDAHNLIFELASSKEG